jgi:hypothetical protein
MPWLGVAVGAGAAISATAAMSLLLTKKAGR